MTDRKLQIETIVSTPFEENCYVARLDGASECLIIDPGLEPTRIIEHLEQENLIPSAILNTHGHADHIGGNEALKKRWPDCPLVIGADEVEMLTDADRNLSAPFGMAILSPPADVTVCEGETYSSGGVDLRVLSIPGHSPGHMVYVWEDEEVNLAFVGDVIFSGGIGRTDFPGGSFEVLSRGIREKLYTLPDDTILLSGHGPPTTVGAEKVGNPFVRP